MILFTLIFPSRPDNQLYKMALLGIQFVISLVVALFLQKLSPFYSLARWIMAKGLYRYLHPTNDQLKALTGKPTNGNQSKG